MTDQTPLSTVSQEPRLYGVIDLLRSDRVAGWVIDRTDPSRTAMVDVLREGRVVGRVTADRPRKDLERQAVGTGNYGFSFTLDPPLEEGMEFTITVIARSHDGIELPLHPAARAAGAVSPEKRVLGRVLAELSALRADLHSLKQDMAASENDRSRFQERLEIVQLRLESGIAGLDAPRGGASGWLTGVAIAGAILAVGSLALGLFSLLTP